jgi:hypothetical protein
MTLNGKNFKKRRIENLIILLNRSSAPEIEMRTSFCQPIFELSGDRGKTNSYFMYDGWNRMGNTFVELFEKFRRGKRSLFSLGPFMPIELLSQKGWCFNQILQGGVPMALAALTKLNLGFESTVLPFDLNVEAEALGATVRYHEEQDGIPVYPTIAHKAVGDADDIVIPEDIDSIGRVPLIASAIAKTRAMADGRGAVGAFVAGPFTLAGQIMDLDKMLVMTMKQPEALCKILSRLSQTIIAVRDAYVRTGAQFIVVQDGGVAAISPKLFSRLVVPFLKDIFVRHRCPIFYSSPGMRTGILGKCFSVGPTVWVWISPAIWTRFGGRYLGICHLLLSLAATPCWPKQARTRLRYGPFLSRQRSFHSPAAG